MGAKPRLKLDLHKHHKNEYAATKTPALVEIGAGRYLAICGRGRPGGPQFQARLSALYGVAYTIKMARKHAGKADYVVAGLEGQYWTDAVPSQPFDPPLDSMNWRLLIRTPAQVSERDLERAVTALQRRAKGEGTQEVVLLSMAEGQCVQMLHVGPYENEPETIARMTEFAEERGLEVHGWHHEIYLSDPARVPPEKLRTILRLPVRPRG